MTLRLRGGGLFLTPIAFLGAMMAGLSATASTPPFPLLLPAVSCGALSLGLALAARHLEITSASRWRTHFRHCALVYPFLIAAAASQGEGLTAAVGPLLLVAVLVTAGADALVLAVQRRIIR